MISFELVPSLRSRDIGRCSHMTGSSVKDTGSVEAIRQSSSACVHHQLIHLHQAREAKQNVCLQTNWAYLSEGATSRNGSRSTKYSRVAWHRGRKAFDLSSESKTLTGICFKQCTGRGKSPRSSHHEAYNGEC